MWQQKDCVSFRSFIYQIIPSVEYNILLKALALKILGLVPLIGRYDSYYAVWFLREKYVLLKIKLK